MKSAKLMATIHPIGESIFEIHLPLRKEDFVISYQKDLGWVVDEFDSRIKNPDKAYRDSSSLSNNMDNSKFPDWNEVFDWIGAFNV